MESSTLLGVSINIESWTLCDREPARARRLAGGLGFAFIVSNVLVAIAPSSGTGTSQTFWLLFSALDMAYSNPTVSYSQDRQDCYMETNLHVMQPVLTFAVLARFRI